MTNKLDETDIKQSKSFSVSPLPEEMITINKFQGMNLFMFLIIAAAIVPLVFGEEQIFGFMITGWAWVIAAVAAILICLGNIRRITFPFRLWLSWIGLLCLYWFLGPDNPDASQSFLQMLTPLVVGCAASTFRPDSLQLENIIRWITRVTWIMVIILLVSMPAIITGKLPSYSVMITEMISLLFFGACYASFYACGSGRHLYYYLAMLAMTVISISRGPIVAMLSCLPLTFAPVTIRKRILLCVALIFCAIIIFNTERMQQRMFWSGRGTVADISYNNPDFRSTGRATFNDILWPEVEEHPWLGNGFNSYRSLFTEFGLTKLLPHNDWLKLLHDMGILGASLYLITMVLQIFFLVRIARWSAGAHQMLSYGAATAFVPYVLIMLTDNVILYVQFFGNLHFAMIGIIYGAMRSSDF